MFSVGSPLGFCCCCVCAFVFVLFAGCMEVAINLCLSLCEDEFNYTGQIPSQLLGPGLVPDPQALSLLCWFGFIRGIDDVEDPGKGAH